MKRMNTRQNRITGIMLFFLGLGIIARKTVNVTGYINIIYGIGITSLWCGLIIAWCILVRHRVIQAGICRHLTAMCIFMILWFLFRGVKYYLVLPESTAARYCWYAYYFPMMFYPVCSVYAIAYIGKREDWEQPRHARLLFVLPMIIGMIVLTNDLHQSVFVFPKDRSAWSDVRYGYGPLYALPFLFFVLCTLVTFVIMFRRCRNPQLQRWYPKLVLLPPFLGFVYALAYISGHTAFFSDFIIVMCLMTVCTFELAIRFGYIRSNTKYQEIFLKSSIQAQIFNKELKLQYASRNFFPYEDKILENTRKHGTYIQGNKRYVLEPIRGGYVVWQEDLTELIHLQRALESANEYLKDRNMVQRKSYESKLRRRKLEEQNRLYNEMQNQTRTKLNKMKQLLDKFADSTADEEKDLLLSIGIMTAYLKRRNNLIFLAKDSRRIPMSELRNCMKESAKMLGIFGITCVIQVEPNVPVTFRQMVVLYDVFEMVIEETAGMYPAYFATVIKEKTGYLFRIRIAGIKKIPKKLQEDFQVIEAEEGDYLLGKRIFAEETSYEEQ